MNLMRLLRGKTEQPKAGCGCELSAPYPDTPNTRRNKQEMHRLIHHDKGDTRARREELTKEYLALPEVIEHRRQADERQAALMAEYRRLNPNLVQATGKKSVSSIKAEVEAAKKKLRKK